MKSRIIIAVDPGSSGGICWGNSEFVQAVGMPATLGDLVELFKELGNEYEITLAYLEKVGGFTGKGQPGSAMFKFGQGYGQLQGIIATLGWPLHLVTPQRWIKSQHLGTKGAMTTTQWKNKLKSQAQMLYPEQKITLKTSDAFLIFNSAINRSI